jgi:hypothetical protein
MRTLSLGAIRSRPMVDRRRVRPGRALRLIGLSRTRVSRSRWGFIRLMGDANEQRIEPTTVVARSSLGELSVDVEGHGAAGEPALMV